MTQILLVPNTDERLVPAWAASTSYGTVGQQVAHLNQVYAVTTPHTSGSTFDATKFTLLGTGSGSGLGSVVVSGTPTAGQEIVATSPTAASWQTPAVGSSGASTAVTGPAGAAGALTGSAITLPDPAGFFEYRAVLNQAVVTITPPALEDGARFITVFDQDAAGGRGITLAGSPTVTDPTGSLNIQAGVVNGHITTAYGRNVWRWYCDGLIWFVIPDTLGPPTADLQDQARAGLSVTPLRSVMAVATGNVVTLAGYQAIDGLTPNATDPDILKRVLLSAQTTASQNGVWVQQAGAWYRPSDFVGQMHLRSVWVVGGTVNPVTQWYIVEASGTGQFTVDTDSLTVAKPAAPSPAVATNLAQGTVELSLAAVSPTNPIAVGDNDTRLPTIALTASDQTTTNLTATDIPGLSIALAASHVYEFEAVLHAACTDGNGNKYAVNFSGGGASGYALYLGGNGGAVANGSTKVLGTLESTALLPAASDGVVFIRGILIIGANAGNFTVQQAKVTSGTATCYANSILKVRRIS